MDSASLPVVMNNTIKSIMIGGSLLAVAAPAYAEIETSAHVGYNSIYEFRGVDLGDNMIESGVELSTELGGGFSLTAGAWYADVRSAPQGNELDLYLAVSKSFGKIDASVGYTYYMYPDSDLPETHEVFFGLSTELPCGTTIGLTYYSDFDEIDGDYLEFTADHSFKLCFCEGGTTLDLSAGAAWSFDYNATTDLTVADGHLSGFNHWFVKAAIPFEVSSGVTVTPYVKYVDADADLIASPSGQSKDYVIGGVSVSYSF